MGHRTQTCQYYCFFLYNLHNLTFNGTFELLPLSISMIVHQQKKTLLPEGNLSEIRFWKNDIHS